MSKIDDMSNLDEQKITKEEKQKKKKEDEKPLESVDGMYLDEDKPKPESKPMKDISGMALDDSTPETSSPATVEGIEERLAVLFGDEEIIYLDILKLKDVITKTRTGRYKFHTDYLEDLDDEELQRLNQMLQKKEKE